MIQLAAPWALVALLAIPAIIALHVLRPRRRTVRVASTDLWREALAERQRGIGLQRLLRSASLVLLLLAALAAGLGLAGPRWLTRTHDSGDTVLVLDTSASMQARSGRGTRFDEALTAAGALVDGLPAQHRVLIMTSAREAVLRSGFETGKDTLRSLLGRLRATDEAGRPQRALALALSLLEDREHGRVVFLTDGAFDPASVPAAAGVDLRLVGAPARNVAVTRFDFRAERGGSDRFQVLLTVRNYTDATVAVPLRVSLEQRTLLARTLDLPAGGAQTLVLPFEGKALGRARATLDVDDDLAVDNSAFAVVNVPEPLRVLLASPGSFYLESVLAAAPGVDTTVVERVDPGELERLARANDVVILDRVPVPALPAGSFLLVDTVPPGLPFTGEARVDAPAIVGHGDSALLEDVDLTGLRVDDARAVHEQPGTPGLQRLFWSADATLALALLEPERRVVYLGFDLSRSSFPLSAAFPLFVARSLQWLRPGAEAGAPAHPRTWVAAGEAVTLRGPTSFTELIMRSPSGDGQALPLDRGALVFDATSRAGIYRYTIGQVARDFAVNLTDATESDLSRRATARAPAAPARRQAAALAITALWPQLAMLALALLAVEWGVWCLGRGRSLA